MAALACAVLLLSGALVALGGSGSSVRSGTSSGIGPEVTSYLVTFRESGLPANTSWSIDLSNNLQNSTASSLTFAKPNGNYSFTVGPVYSYSPYPSSGRITVNGRNITVPIDFTYDLHPVTFQEIGLPSGINWSVSLNGSAQSSATPSLVFNEPNGSYAFNLGAVLAFSATPNVGSVTVVGAAVVQPITFTANLTNTTYPVTFTESGLPLGTEWYANVTGSPSVASTSSTATIDLPNCTYSYSIASTSPLYGPSAANATFNVTGSPVAVSVAFSRVMFNVTFDATGLPAGTNWSVDLGGTLASSESSSIAFVRSNGTYPYSVGVPAGYTADPSAGNATVVGTALGIGIAIRAIPPPTNYTVTFSETGLPTGDLWYLDVAGQPAALSTTTSAVIALINGTYGFSIVSANTQYAPSPYGGNFTVSGAPVFRSVEFSPVIYRLTFTETGLPNGTVWEVTLAGGQLNTSSNSIGFEGTNGTYAFTIGPIANYSIDPRAGNLTVYGRSVTQEIAFRSTIPLYSVRFTETGLPTGTPWYLNVTGQPSAASFSTSVTLTLANGTYPFTVATSDGGFTPSPASGNVTVAGGNLTESVTFLAVYLVSFSEAGLPAATTWSVILDGAIRTTSADSISFDETNGVYAYSTVPPPGYAATPLSGSVTVPGGDLGVSIHFDFLYTLTLTETTLPAGTNWSATLSGSAPSVILGGTPDGSSVALTRWSNGSASILFRVSSGSYSYTTFAQGRPSTAGDVNITDASVPPVNVGFPSTPSSSAPSGLPLLDYVLIGAVAFVALAIGVAVGVRRGRSPPRPGTAPTRPPPWGPAPPP
jgi:hypothetical protein